MKDDIKIIDLDEGGVDREEKVVSLGNFDGIHRGHQKLMRENINLSKEMNLIPAALLFKENSKKTLTDEREYLTSMDDKIEFLSQMGIKTFCILEFSDEFKSLSPYDFIKNILHERLNAKVLVVGNDYRFGYKASGNVDFLKSHEDEFDYRVNVVDYEFDGDNKISSSIIKDYLREGKINEANYELGRPYQIEGEVVHGYKRGKTLNFPTANLGLDFSYVIPCDGVFLTKVRVKNNEHYALTNIGTNPTFENDERKIETYILDFDDDIYGEDLIIEFLEFFRGDVKFDSVDDLIIQMENDKKRAYEVINQKYL